MPQKKSCSVILVGTSHTYQYPNNAGSDAFRDFIQSVCGKRKARAVAEELSVEALQEKAASQSVCEIVAANIGVTHRHCDPTSLERAELGIQQETLIRARGFLENWGKRRFNQEIRASHDIRERHWLRQLLALDRCPVVFVCGANHVTAFQNKLRENGIGVGIAHRDWEPK